MFRFISPSLALRLRRVPRTQVIALTLLTAVMASGVVAPTPVEADPTSAPSEQGPSVPPAVNADPSAWPLSGAEILERRTADTKTYATDLPGRFRTKSSPVPLHFQAGDGSWLDIDNSLVPSDGGLTNAANAFALEIAHLGSTTRLASLRLDDEHSVGFGLVGALPVAVTTPEQDATKARFASILPSVSLELTSHATGVKEDIVLASPAAPNTFVFPLHLQGLTAELVDGEIHFTDASGVLRVARTPRGFMVDSAGPEGSEAMSDSVSYELISVAGQQAVRLTANRSWLDDPARVYPIRIDPNLHHVGNSASASYRNPCGWSENPSPVRVGNARPCGGGDAYWRSVMYYPYENLFGKRLVGARIRLFARNEGTQNAYATAITHATQFGWDCVRGGYQQSANGENEQNFYNDLVFSMYNDAINAGQGGLAVCFAGWENPGLYTYKRFDGNELFLDWEEPPPVNRDPFGSIDDVSSAREQIHVGGWALDPDLGGPPIDVHVYIGASGYAVTANGYRPDVHAVHGLGEFHGYDRWFNVASGTHNVCIYAINWPGGNNPQLGCRSVYVPPITAPSPPTNVNATADIGTANVSWNLSADHGGASIDSYLVKAYHTNGAYSGISKNVPCNCGSAAVTGLAAGTSYYFGVEAHNSRGYSTAANSNTVTTPAAPGAPTNVTATAGYASGSVRWTAPPSNGRPITSYTLSADNLTTSTSTVVTCTSCVSTREYEFTALVPGQNYRFRVRATNAVGTGVYSSVSNSITVEPTVTVAPTNVRATRGDRQATVQWDAPTGSVAGRTTYDVHTYRASDNTRIGSKSAGTGLSTPVTGLTNGVAIYFRVTSTNAVVTSPESEPSNTVTPAGLPLAPMNVTATRGDGALTIAWNAADGNGAPITRYVVRVRRSSDDVIARTREVTGSQTSTPVGGLTNGASYYAEVQATNEIGDGPFSARSNDAVPAGRPTPPSNVTATAGAGQATVSWDPSSPNGDAIVRYNVTAQPGGAVQSTVNGATNSLTFTGLANGTSYTFTVTATNGVGASDPSAASNPVVPIDVPGPVTSVTATSAVGGDGPRVTWSAPNANGAPLIYYRVTASNGKTHIVHGGVSSFTFSELSNGSYTFRVTAVNTAGAGAMSAPSNSATFALRPTAPSNLSVAAVAGDASRATLNWTPSAPRGTPLRGYRATAISAADGSKVTQTVNDPSGTSTQMAGLTRRPYYFTLVALSDAGDSDPSAQVGLDTSVPRYVSVGDSFISGEGVGNYLDDSDCHRSADSYSARFEPSAVAAPGLFLACSGAKMNNLLDDGQNGEESQLERIPVDTNLLTVSIGGNDAGFVMILAACFGDDIHAAVRAAYLSAYGTDMREFDCRQPEVEAEIEALEDDLFTTYRRLHERARKAAIRVINYPKFLSPESQTCESTILTNDDRQWLIAQFERMNRVIGRAVNTLRLEGVDIEVVDIEDAFEGHEICTQDEWINGISQELTHSFHPNAKGHAAILGRLKAAVGFRRPVVTGVSPSSGLDNRSACSNQTVTITGANLGPDPIVTFGATQVPAVVVSSTELRVQAPPRGIGTVPVTVRTNTGLNAGVSAETVASQYEYRADTDTPTTNATTTPAANAAGWHRQNVTVNLAPTDPSCTEDVTLTFSAQPGSIGGQTIPTTVVNGPGSLSITAEGETIVSFQSKDAYGNTETLRTLSVKIDKTSPRNVTVSADRPADRNGWYNHAFTARWTGQDDLSGIASCTETPYTGPDTTAGTLAGTCQDVAGNTSAQVPFTFKYDATAPTQVSGTASRPPDSNGWYNRAFSVAFSGTDAASGIESCSSASYGGPDGRNVTLIGTCTDAAGNTGTGSFGPFNYDATRPTAAIDGDGAQVQLSSGQLTGTAADNLSGVGTVTVRFVNSVTGAVVTRTATCTSGCSTVSARWSVSLTGLAGAYTVTATSTDVAGNQSNASAPVTLIVV